MEAERRQVTVLFTDTVGFSDVLGTVGRGSSVYADAQPWPIKPHLQITDCWYARVLSKPEKEKHMGTLVTETPAASFDAALRHFGDILAFETDCWDVHESLKSPNPDFILVDVRGPTSFANGHVRGHGPA